MNLEDTHIIILQQLTSEFKPKYRKLYRTIKEVLGNPFRYVKNTSSDLGKNLNDLATQVIKLEKGNPIVVIPTGESSINHDKDYHVVITKESISIVRCPYIAFKRIQPNYPIDLFINRRTLLRADKFRKLYKSPFRDLL